MLDNLYKLAKSDNAKRKSALKKILDISSIPYVHQEGIISDVQTENIIVRFGRSKKRLVIGAHFDSVEGSTGANDNATGVCVLIELAKALLHFSPAPNIDIVFFDLEENGGRGSKLYIETVGKENIPAMLNFDICGVGDSILIAPEKNIETHRLSTAVGQMDKKKHNFEVISMLPPGDDRVFEDAGISSLSVCIISADDVDAMKKLFSAASEVPKEEYPSIIETMHNGPRDNADVVSLDAMEKVYEFAHDLVINYIYAR